MLLGFFSPIIDAVSGWITDALNAALGWLIKNVIGPLVSVVTSLVMYWLSLYFYQISIFLLALVDFVEALFRALVGLPAKANGFKLQFTNGNGATPEDVDGDILVQLIRSETVQSAFVSMVIVGLFLLVVTSVFQIIKTEYTTEGAKNAKGPILQKALKGLGNLILLPALVVLGIVFSNHLLILLDTATGNSEGSMSSQIFVAASQKAIYQPKDFCIRMSTSIPDLAVVDLMVYAIPIAMDTWKNSGPDWGKFDQSVDLKLGSIETFYSKVKGGDDSWDKNAINGEGDNATTNVEAVEELFTNRSEKYFLMNDVSKYYNYSRINYLLLILGSCIAIKCLYYTCFGLVVRLWKCLMLFIISPVIVGMTPINEGGLGKWRGQFIGQVLSGYGTVLALNLFFILINVMLSIDIVAVSPNTIIGSLDGLSDGLFKMMIVISGCLMIEKFAKELGGWFGAEDAMGAGKDMSKQVGDIAMQGVAVAATVAGAAATGGASLATKAVGLAGKLGSAKKAGGAAIQGAQEQGKGKFRAGLSGLKAFGSTMYEGSKLEKGVNSVTDPFRGSKRSVKKADNALVSARLGLANAKNSKAYAQAQLDKATTAEDKAKWKERVESDDKEIKRAEKILGKAEQKSKSVHGAEGRWGDTKGKIKETAMKGEALVEGYVAGAKDEVKGMMPWSKRLEKFDKTTRAGMKKLGPHHQAVIEGIDKDKEKSVQDQAATTLAARYFAGQAAHILGKELGQEFANAVKNLGLDETSRFKQMNQVSKSIKDDERRQEYMEQQYASAVNSGMKIDFDKFSQLVNNAGGSDFKINLEEDLNIKLDPSAIQKAVEQAAAKSKDVDKIREAVMEEMRKAGVEGNVKMIKMVEEAITRVMQNAGGGK